jgi:hypothetical protein
LKKNNQICPEIILFLESAKKKLSCTKNKKVVYSANFGSYDLLREPKFVDSDVDYIYFTDNADIKSEIWSVILIEVVFSDARMTARILKHLPHVFLTQYNSSLWLDARIILDKYSANLIFSKMNKEKFMCFRHPKRNRVFFEALSCIKMGHDSVWKIILQYLEYRFDGFSDQYQLIESGVLLRKHLNKNVCLFQEKWLMEIFHKTVRDQLSFNYIASKFELTYAHFPETMSQLFTLTDHARHGVYTAAGFNVPFQRHIYRIVSILRDK